jgi:hypothetical protein
VASPQFNISEPTGIALLPSLSGNVLAARICSSRARCRRTSRARSNSGSKQVTLHVMNVENALHARWC